MDVSSAPIVTRSIVTRAAPQQGNTMTKAASQLHSPGSTDYHEAIFDEQVRLLYRHTIPLLIVNFLIGSAVIYGFWPVASSGALIGWGSLIFATCVLRFGLYLVYINRSAGADNRIYSKLFIATCVLSGIVWGSASIIFFQSDALQYQLLILFILAGMGAGSVASLCAYRPAFFAYFLPSMAPIMVRLLIEEGHTHNVLSFLCSAFIIGMCFFALQINRSFMLSLKFRFENAALVVQLREQKDEADKANQAKSKFLAAASHDLRQPLHALTLFTSLLTENLESPQNKKLASQINRSLEALQSLFNALLDISRLEAGTLVPEIRDFRVGPMLERIHNDFSGDATKKNIKLLIETDDFVAQSDSSLLEQILRNYVSNAIRYTAHGSITLSCAEINHELLFTVKDTGIGIPADQLDEIYDEFHQLRNPERDRSKGLGLGLAIVKRISKLLDHPIEVQSTVAHGSCFSIRVPAGSTEQVREFKPNTVTSSPAISNRTVNVVIIDDDIDVRESMEALFLNWGCKTYVCATPQSVVEKLRQDGAIPDAIIADYRLRDGRTGIGAIDLLKAQYGDNIPSLIITGDTASEPLQAIQNSGIPLINKPVSPAKLRTFLNRAYAVEAPDTSSTLDGHG